MLTLLIWQAAAEEVTQKHPEGIDYLIICAGMMGKRETYVVTVKNEKFGFCLNMNMNVTVGESVGFRFRFFVLAFAFTFVFDFVL